MATEAELEQAVIERWTGKQEAEIFRIRAKVGATTLFTIYRWQNPTKAALKQGRGSVRYVKSAAELTPVDTGTHWTWQVVAFIRTT